MAAHPPASSPSPRHLLAEATSGALFGAALLLSGVASPAVIHAQLRFTQFHMLQVFLGGSACSALILELSHRRGLYTKSHPSPRTLGFFPYDGNVLGGALIGLGMAATGACPGTSLVQLAEGTVNGALVVLGGVLGAGLFAKVGPMLLLHSGRESASASSAEATTTPRDTAPRGDSPPASPAFPPKSLDIPTALSLQPATTLLLWIPLCLSIIALAKFLDSSASSNLLFPAAGVLPPAYGGLLIGLAQAGTVLLTRHHIGASSAYEDFARWIGGRLLLSGKQGAEDATPRPLMTPSMSFAAGIVCAVAMLQSLMLGSQNAASDALAMSLPSTGRTIAGGASMVFGARLAGGCTSGHGISGLSKFSLASAATTAAIFVGGMVSARFIGV